MVFNTPDKPRETQLANTFVHRSMMNNGWTWFHVVQMALWPWASTENSSRVRDKARSVVALVNTEHTEATIHSGTHQPPQRELDQTDRISMNPTCMHTRRPLTFAIRFEISVHRRGLAVTEHWPARRGLGTGAEAHVGGRGDLFPQGGELHGARGHGHIVRFVHWLRQSARVMVWRRVGTHGYVVLVWYLFCGLAAHWHHSFIFLRGKKADGHVHKGQT